MQDDVKPKSVPIIYNHTVDPFVGHLERVSKSHLRVSQGNLAKVSKGGIVLDLAPVPWPHFYKKI